MNGVFIIITVISAVIAAYVVILLAWLTKKNEFTEYRKKLLDFEVSRKQIVEDIENDKRRFK